MLLLGIIAFFILIR